MSYIHKGIVLTNGTVDHGVVNDDSLDLTVHPEDDGSQIIDYKKGDFEWWYFDVIDSKAGCFLKIVLHIGTDPLRTRIYPQLAISVNTPEKSVKLFYPLVLEELESDTHQCNISAGDQIKIQAEIIANPVYYIRINIPDFECDFRFKGKIEGWKPLGNKVKFHSGKKNVDFSWVIPLPASEVEGDFTCEHRKYTLIEAKGYHDHNYIKPGRMNPLYMDDLVNRWYWGKCSAGIYTVIFGDVLFRTRRILSLMVAEYDKIIHSSNNLIDCSVLSTGYDSIFKAEYPAALHIRSLDNSFPFMADFTIDKILDRRDLLEEVSPPIKFLIKLLISRPVYHGILANVTLEIKNKIIEGSGNFESMIFRGK